MAGKTIAYFVHDLQDSAVVRRVALLRHAGLDVRVAGFHRRDVAPVAVADAPAFSLGRTQDGKLKARLISVLRHVMFAGSARAVAEDADVLIARNLETLIIAVRVRRRGQRLVYECLDIHRLMLGQGVAGGVLRWIERHAMRRLDLLMISAPSFLTEYFLKRGDYRGRSLLIENKVPAYAGGRVDRVRDDDTVRGGLAVPGASTPWVIGWFGMLRCRKTLAMLGRLAAGSNGRIQVVIAGKPSPAEFTDFAGQVAQMPGVTYLGAYGPADLAALFGRIHFIWAIDYFEEGLNSQWLLPNRLYEGIAHGAVPIALDQVATGQWLRQRGAGLRLTDPVAELGVLLNRLTLADYMTLRAGVAAIPDHDVLLLPDEYRRCIAEITGADITAAPIMEAAA